jgi:hypothetical protein
MYGLVEPPVILKSGRLSWFRSKVRLPFPGIVILIGVYRTAPCAAPAARADVDKRAKVLLVEFILEYNPN